MTAKKKKNMMASESQPIHEKPFIQSQQPWAMLTGLQRLLFSEDFII